MDKKSQLKVIAKGFTILRSDDQPSPRIKYIDKQNHEWKTFSKHEAKAERDRSLAEWLTGPMYIQD